jgi:hypothetical protein
MYRPGGFEIGRPGYRFADDAARIEDLPVAIWSTKTLTSVWRRQFDKLIESNLVSNRPGQVSGTIEHHLPLPLERWMLVYDETVYQPALEATSSRGMTLEPNERVRVSPTAPAIKQRVLSAFLKGTKQRRIERALGQGGSQILVEQDPYDPLSRDAESIVLMLSFHGKADGATYTGLENDDLRGYDLTQQLQLGRAVLFGKIKLPACRLNLDGRQIDPEEHVAFVRAVLPVANSKTELQTLPELKTSKASP